MSGQSTPFRLNLEEVASPVRKGASLSRLAPFAPDDAAGGGGSFGRPLAAAQPGRGTGLTGRKFKDMGTAALMGHSMASSTACEAGFALFGGVVGSANVLRNDAWEFRGHDAPACVTHTIMPSCAWSPTRVPAAPSTLADPRVAVRVASRKDETTEPRVRGRGSELTTPPAPSVHDFADRHPSV